MHSWFIPFLFVVSGCSGKTSTDNPSSTQRIYDAFRAQHLISTEVTFEEFSSDLGTCPPGITVAECALVDAKNQEASFEHPENHSEHTFESIWNDPKQRAGIRDQLRGMGLGDLVGK